MSGTAEASTSAVPPLRLAEVQALPLLRRLAGRNRTKADLLVYRGAEGDLALKSYAARPWPIRNTLGRLLIRREARAYSAAAGLVGLPRFLGRVGPFALAIEWIRASPLADSADGTVEPLRFDKLESVLAGLHRRGVALADLNHRDLLLAADGSVYIVDLAMACVLGKRPGIVRRRLFDHFRLADRFALARLRARFTGEDPAAAIGAADPRVLAWHRRARRLKWRWDRLRGATRLPPVDDHWRFQGYDRRLGLVRLAGVYLVIGALLVGSHPTPAGVLAGGLFVILGQALRVWASGHLVKNVSLITSGPYRYTRNPLYLGRLLIFAGLCVMAQLPHALNWLLLVAGCAVFFGYYLPRKERVEPARLAALHGDAFERYRRSVPALWPTTTPYDGGRGRWSISRARGNREHWMIAGLLAATLYLFWRAYSP